MDKRRVSVCMGICILFFFVQSLRSEENVAFGKTAKQQSNYDLGNWTAEKVVDGCLNQYITSGCCTHTAQGEISAWWQVHLGSLSTISFIRIYYRDGFATRFAGYQLYLSNTTDWTQGVLCYEDTSSNWTDVQLVVTHQCPYVAQYVTVYNYRSNPKRHDWYDDEAMLELCEVQVFGCPIEKYGQGHCNQTCSDSCYGGNCDASTGSCFYCLPGKWGDTCDRDCPTTCIGCSIDGSCTDCVYGKWGETCDQDCSTNCEDCIQNNGSCIDCVYGKWGETCDRDCSTNCEDCIQNNGSCIDCSLGKHGNSCELYCPTHCANDVCDREFGICIDCQHGKRGKTCDMDCSIMCKDLFCEKDTGFCSECKDGMYGYKCEKTCPAECGSSKCRRSDGTCEDTDTDTCTCTPTDNITTVAVLATVAALCLVAGIVSFVYMLRIKTAVKKEQGKEEHYTDIDMAGRVVPNAYEMASSNVVTN